MLCVDYYFFFKQQTAYATRISDWSSDVCSSDLLDRDRREIVVRELADEAAELFGEAHIGAQLRRFLGRQARHVDRVGDAAGQQIGRASCRERVCQYV